VPDLAVTKYAAFHAIDRHIELCQTSQRPSTFTPLRRRSHVERNCSTVGRAETAIPNLLGGRQTTYAQIQFCRRVSAYEATLSILSSLPTWNLYRAIGFISRELFLFCVLDINIRMDTRSQPDAFNEDDLTLVEELFYCEDGDLKQEFSAFLDEIRLRIRKTQTHSNPECSLTFHPECAVVNVSGVESTISLNQ
jgi:hypothetical protein